MAERDNEGRIVKKRAPLKGVRKMIADRMLESARNYPQGTAILEVDATALKKFRESLGEKGIKVSYGDLFVKATACALEEVPELNGSRLEDELVYYESVNIGMMASINGFLMEPVLENAPSKDIEQIAVELAEIYENLKNNKLMRVKLDGATFAVSNLGKYHVDGFTPLLSPPKGAILGIGRMRIRPVIDDDGGIVARPTFTLSVTTDHGLVDGVPAVRFLEALEHVIQTPEEFMYRKTEVEVEADA